VVNLLDVNVLLALAWPPHVHHAAARSWFEKASAEGWATTPLTELGFVRLSSNPSLFEDPASPSEAAAQLLRLKQRGAHAFWPDDIEVVSGVDGWGHVLSHRHVTDARLVMLADRHNGRVATFDRRLQARAEQQVLRIPELRG